MSELNQVLSHPIWKEKPGSRTILVSLSMPTTKVYAIAKGVQELWDDGRETFRSSDLSKKASKYHYKPLSTHMVAYHMRDVVKYMKVEAERDNKYRRLYRFKRP